MKRIGNLYNQICSVDNLKLADRRACIGKSNQYGVKEHLKNRDENIVELNRILLAKTFRTSTYKTFEVFEPKRREIFRLPYFPDRIVHHAVMNILEPIWVSMFTADTYSCIKGRGVHCSGRKIKKALKDRSGTKFCLKLDVTKFYPSIDHQVMKTIIRKKIKDQDLLELLDEIIDSADGLPIGNYLSQYMANLYLTYFDHWIKEQMGVKYYFRYCDDMVILHESKPFLHKLLAAIRGYLSSNLNLQVKKDYQVFPVAMRGIDFVGYRFYPSHTLLRKSIKQRFARAIAKGKGRSSIASYRGWAKHANCINLLNTLDKIRHEKFQRFQDKNRSPVI